MLINLKKDVKPFKIHDGKEWRVINNGSEVDDLTYRAIKNKVTKVKKEGDK